MKHLAAMFAWILHQRGLLGLTLASAIIFAFISPWSLLVLAAGCCFFIAWGAYDHWRQYDACGPEHAPQDVRIVMTTGEVVPVGVHYIGIEDGIHRWVTDPVVGDIAQVKIRTLPARTAVAVTKYHAPRT